jgi:hypothetical protein
MNPRIILMAIAFLPVAYLSAQQPSDAALKQMAQTWESHHQRAVAINDLAGNLQSLKDARTLVDRIADEFSDRLPPKWLTHGIRNRIAKAEYESAVDPGVLISEKQIADAWNDYVERIDGPQEAIVTPEEIHYLRDSLYTNAKMIWAIRGAQNIWTVPNIYAIGPDGKVAEGCRALEALNVLWQIATQPDKLRGARELIKKKMLFSDEMTEWAKAAVAANAQATNGGGNAVVVNGRMAAQFVAYTNPVEDAERRYLKEHGMIALNRAIEAGLNDLFPR